MIIAHFLRVSKRYRGELDPFVEHIERKQKRTTEIPNNAGGRRDGELYESPQRSSCSYLHIVHLPSTFRSLHLHAIVRSDSLNASKRRPMSYPRWRGWNSCFVQWEKSLDREYLKIPMFYGPVLLLILHTSEMLLHNNFRKRWNTITFFHEYVSQSNFTKGWEIYHCCFNSIFDFLFVLQKI